MTKKFYLNEKFQAWFYPILYFVLAVSIVITGCFIFKKKFYQPIVVNGQSMWPTLSGGGSFTEQGSTTYHLRYNYGLADINKSSVNGLHRFDVVVTYYPKGWGGSDEDYKIKRVWGFPGETIALTYDEEKLKYTFRAYKQGQPTYEIKSTRKEFTQTFETSYVEQGQTKYKDCSLTYLVNEFVLPHKTFRTTFKNPFTGTTKIRTIHKELKKDEYFVMGDNWLGSTDSYENITNPNRLTANDLQGRVICINAYVTYNSATEETSDMHPIKERYDF